MGEHANQDRSKAPVAPSSSESDHTQHSEDVTQPTAALTRRLSVLPESLDVGSQVVGSTHTYDVGQLFNVAVGRGDATCTARIEGAGFTEATAPHMLVEVRSMTKSAISEALATPVKVTFVPPKPGWFEAKLTVTARWPDGRVETQTVLVHGRGFDRRTGLGTDGDEAAQAPAEEAVAVPDVDLAQDHVGGIAAARFSNLYTDAQVAALSLASKQADAVGIVYDEIGTYVPPPAPRSLWWDLAELALTLAAAEISAGVGSALGPALASAFVADSAKAADSALAKAVTGTVKDGLKLAAGAGIKKLSPAELENLSSDGQIAFFEAQVRALRKQGAENKEVITRAQNKLLPLLMSEPGAAVRGMEAIGVGIAAQDAGAVDVQKRATASQWIAYRSRLAAGPKHVAGRTISDIGPDRTVIEVLVRGNPQPRRPSTNPTPFPSLLDIGVEVDHGGVRVRQAYVSGVAQALADEVASANLDAARIPLRLVVEGNTPEPTIITRDEAGRVRVTGNLRRLQRFSGDEIPLVDELQAERAARTFFEIVTSKPLKEWGVTLDTDDVGGRAAKARALEAAKRERAAAEAESPVLEAPL